MGVNDWTLLSPSTVRLPGRDGTIYPRPWCDADYDEVNDEVVFYEGYEDGSDYAQTIYSNCIFGYHKASNEFRMKRLMNWQNTTPGNGYSIAPLAANSEDPTPVDTHPNFCCLGGSLYRFGGVNSNIQGSGGVSDEAMWRIDLTTGVCTQLTLTGTLPRGKAVNFAMAADRRRRNVMIVGAPTVNGGNTVCTWLVNVDTLVSRQVSGSPPTVEANGCLCYDDIRDGFWLIGGGYDGTLTIRFFDCKAEAWRTVTANNSGPSSRVYHMLRHIHTEDLLVLHGGAEDWDDSPASYLNDTWTLDPEPLLWT